MLKSQPGPLLRLLSELRLDYPHNLILFLFFGHDMCACGVLVSRPGIEPTSLVVGAWSLNYWIIREVPLMPLFSYD